MRLNAEQQALRIAAYHETTHLLACERFGIPVAEIKVWVEHRLFGGPRPNGYVRDTGNLLVNREDWILMRLAGPEAQARIERELHGGSLDSRRDRAYRANDDGVGSDVRDARDAVRLASFTWRRAQLLAADLVDELWPRIGPVAAVVAERRHLTGREIQAVTRTGARR